MKYLCSLLIMVLVLTACGSGTSGKVVDDDTKTPLSDEQQTEEAQTETADVEKDPIIEQSNDEITEEADIDEDTIEETIEDDRESDKDSAAIEVEDIPGYWMFVEQILTQPENINTAKRVVSYNITSNAAFCESKEIQTATGRRETEFIYAAATWSSPEIYYGEDEEVKISLGTDFGIVRPPGGSNFVGVDIWTHFGAEEGTLKWYKASEIQSDDGKTLTWSGIETIEKKTETSSLEVKGTFGPGELGERKAIYMRVQLPGGAMGVCRYIYEYITDIPVEAEEDAVVEVYSDEQIEATASDLLREAYDLVTDGEGEVTEVRLDPKEGESGYWKFVDATYPDGESLVRTKSINGAFSLRRSPDLNFDERFLSHAIILKPNSAYSDSDQVKLFGLAQMQAYQGENIYHVARDMAKERSFNATVETYVDNKQVASNQDSISFSRFNDYEADDVVYEEADSGYKEVTFGPGKVGDTRTIKYYVLLTQDGASTSGTVTYTYEYVEWD